MREKQTNKKLFPFFLPNGHSHHTTANSLCWLQWHTLRQTDRQHLLKSPAARHHYRWSQCCWSALAHFKWLNSTPIVATTKKKVTNLKCLGQQPKAALLTQNHTLVQNSHFNKIKIMINHYTKVQIKKQQQQESHKCSLTSKHKTISH